MAIFTHTLRLVVGLALVAGGVVLAQPFVAAVLAARQHTAAPGRDAVPLDVRRSAPPDGGLAALWPSAFDGNPGPRRDSFVAGSQAFQPPQSAGVAAGMPAVMPPSRPAPAAPTPLPRSAAEFTPAAPVLDGAYRSTLDIPPPPLLDTQTPPPLAVGWSSHDAPRPAVVATDDTTAPSTYVVRDGDDLTGIALRVYGSAGAAGAIWAANRDRLPDPQLLPIGMVLRMPPSWTLPSAHAGHGTGGSQSIEPTFGTAAPTAASWRTARPVSVDQRATGASPWLQQGDGGAGGYPAQQPPDSRNAVPHTVRVTDGDSLESIAVRVYGDRAAAPRIWQANKDRLRSPDLLVPGTELRLP